MIQTTRLIINHDIIFQYKIFTIKYIYIYIYIYILYLLLINNFILLIKYISYILMKSGYNKKDTKKQTETK